VRASNGWVALLGRCDHPTDALEDYCRYLGEALAARGYPLQVERVNWPENGRLRSLYGLWRKARTRRGQWALVQYTALGWSRRGFPLMFLAVLSLLRLRKVRLAVVFHDPEAYAGRRLVDKLRRACQLFVMRCAYWLAHVSILCVLLESVSWLPPKPIKASFIPIGANIPAKTAPGESARNGNEPKTIAVFVVTDAGDVTRELSDITLAAKRASERLHRVRLVTFGRGSLESASRIRQALEGTAVEYNALGILPAEQVSQVLAKADVSLFARGPLATQRGSAIASIACAVPLVAYTAPRLPAPFAEAGVVSVGYRDAEELAEAAVRVLTDHELQCELRERSRRAHEKYFSWEAVAARFLEVLAHA
jgi:glycosyltransferase involved in cell wall biosynthesis